MNSTDRSESDSINSADPLSDSPEIETPIPSLDDIEPDTLRPNEIVIIRGRVCQFLYREEHGPRFYFDTEAQKPFALHTTDILGLMESKDYIRPGEDTPSLEIPAELNAARSQYLRMALGSIRKTPREAAEAKFLYVGHFLSKILSAPEGLPFSKNEANAQIVIDEVDAAIEKKNKELPKAKQIACPARRRPRTVLWWLQKECERHLGPVGQVHL